MERIMFLAASLWLAVMALQFASTRPGAEFLGPQTLRANERPGRLRAPNDDFAATSPLDLKFYLFGPRPDPFHVDWAESGPVKLPSGGPRSGTDEPDNRLVPIVRDGGASGEEAAVDGFSERAENRRARLVGRIALGEYLRGLLRDSRDGSMVLVRDGDVLPELGIATVRVTDSDLTVVDAAGRRESLRGVSPRAPRRRDTRYP